MERQTIIRHISERTIPAPCVDYRLVPVDEIFGEHIFDERTQRELLPKNVFNALQKSIKEETSIQPAIAEAVAEAMKEWAIACGATHFCHWFQPLTDLTAEKHDSLFVPTKDGRPLVEFGGSALIRGEPDASSFPTGGLRTTFEARGYTAWDPSSPPYIIETVNGAVLVIPTFFLSWNGEALDKKIPLFRSTMALSTQAVRLLRLCGDTKTTSVHTTVGAEQEFFLIDKLFYHERPDLVATGRTLFGSKPHKGQELEDQYLGVIPERILAVLSETEYELMRIGIPIKTRHNEVAPSQYEIALHHQTANVAADHHMCLMEMLRRVSKRHGMVCLLHEKPFSGINGSGKHTNWSMAKEDGTNLLVPGKTVEKNLQFLLFFAAVVRGVHKHALQLRLSIGSAGNDHRLGMHEAPPAIISVDVGEQLFDLFTKLSKGKIKEVKQEGSLKSGLDMLPEIPRHASDRNRTSPFAFTGDKFEFRAVGSSSNISKPVAFLNTVVADSLDHFATQLEKSIAKGKDFKSAALELLAAEAKEFLPVVFEGDNYDPKWAEEAKKRGLPNIKNTVDVALLNTKKETIDLFAKYNVLSKRELESREEIMLSKYVKTVRIEAETASDIIHTQIVPVCLKYARKVGETLPFLPKSEKAFSEALGNKIAALRQGVERLDQLLAKEPKGNPHKQAVYFRDRVLTTLEELRVLVDDLEKVVDDNLWPLPKYHEMLCIR